MHIFPQHDGKGIGLLPGRTPGDPHAQSVLFGFPFKQIWQCLFFKRFKRFRIPEKVSNPD